MKKPYSQESWTRFKDLMQKLTKRTALIETRSELNEQNIEELQPEVEELQETVGEINDITTATNLFRGTRDFVQSSSSSADSNVDGFSQSSTFYNLSKDDEGYGVATIEHDASTTSRYYYPSIIRDVEPNQDYTFAFDVKVDDIESATNSTALFSGQLRRPDKTAVVTYSSYNIQKLKSDHEAVSGTWYRVSIVYNSGNDIPEGAYFLMFFNVNGAGTFHFRKLTAYKGNINNPEWSPSPFDIDYINDITTGINLLRGTRDFTIGTINSLSKTYYDDGFRSNSSTYIVTEIDSDGFTNISVNAPSDNTTAYYFVSSVVRGLKTGDIVTMSFEFMFTDQTAINSIAGKSFMRYDIIQSNGDVGNGSNFQLDSGINEIVEPGKWYRWSKTTTIMSGVDYDCGIIWSPRFSGAGTVKFRKYSLYHGAIENPEWSASPFDYVSDAEDAYLMGNLNPKREIPTGTDLNKFMGFGVWYTSDTPNNRGITNAPINQSGKLYQELTIGNSAVPSTTTNRTQKYVTFNGSTYFRRMLNNTTFEWTPWTLETDSNGITPIEGGGTGGKTLEEAQTNLKIFNAKTTTPISDSNSANDGYSVFDPNTANTPISGAYGIIEQIRNSSGPWLMQRASTTSGNGPLEFIRSNINNSGWTSWDEILTKKYYPQNPGLYTGRSIADIFKKEIGSNHIANWLSSRVSQGNFEGLNIGDFVDINCSGVTRRYVIAAFDPYYKCGNPTMNQHHIVMVPTVPWSLDSSRDGAYAINTSNLYWNTTATNNGTSVENAPYVTSNLHKWETEVAVKQFPTEWQNVMIDRICYMETKYSASSTLTSSNGVAWKSLGKLWSLSLIEVFGSNRSLSSNKCGLSDCHFAFFGDTSKAAYYPNATQLSYWLRDTIDDSSTTVAIADSRGFSTSVAVNHTTIRPRPCFLLG